MAKNRYSSSSRRWLNQHFNDKYVRIVQFMEIRSRAWFKIHQINNIDFLFRTGMTVVDLGSAPGSWSQYVKKK